MVIRMCTFMGIRFSVCVSVYFHKDIFTEVESCILSRGTLLYLNV